MTFIIAEIGSNFRTLPECIKTIELSKEAGADAVKFQLASSMELYNEDLGESFDSNFIKKDWLPTLKNVADLNRIDFMCSAFSERGYHIVNPFVRRHKIASCESNHPGILKTVGEFGKETYVSVGGSCAEEITKIFNCLIRRLDYTKLYVLYCEVEYPCKYPLLDNIKWIEDNLTYLTGFSDHSTSINMPQIAVKGYGAKVIEKHFNPLGLTDTPDEKHSLSMDDFTTMVNGVRRKTNGNYRHTPTPHKRTIIATRNISEGERFTIENIGIFRSRNGQTGPSALTFSSVLNMKSDRQYIKGDIINGNV